MNFDVHFVYFNFFFLLLLQFTGFLCFHVSVFFQFLSFFGFFF